jgi:hypothetical protein
MRRVEHRHTKVYVVALLTNSVLTLIGLDEILLQKILLDFVTHFVTCPSVMSLIILPSGYKGYVCYCFLIKPEHTRDTGLPSETEVRMNSSSPYC